MLFDDMEEEESEDFGAGAPAAEARHGGLLPPREVAECLGHGEIEKLLLSLFNDGKLPHALIFAGTEGIGKSVMAFRLARFLLKNGQADEGPGLFGGGLPAGKPESLHVAPDDRIFRQVVSGGNPDFLVIERAFDEKKGKRGNTIGVDDVRRVAPFLRMKAWHDGGWRVVIVDDADTMTVAAQNAILKILEEPPPRTLLVLVAHRPAAMIATIRSRCRVMPFLPLSQDIFNALLKREHTDLTAQDMETLYGMMGGSAGQALALAAQGGVESIAQVMGLLAGWPHRDWTRVHAQAEVVGRGGEGAALQSFRTVMLWIFDSVLRARACGLPLTGVLDNDAVLRLMNHYPLADWIEICENLKTHFDTVDFANLDKRQAVIGAFSVLDHKEAA